MTVWAKNGEIMRNNFAYRWMHNYVPSSLKVTFLKCFFTLALQSRWRFLRSSSEMLIFSLLAARNIFFIKMQFERVCVPLMDKKYNNDPRDNFVSFTDDLLDATSLTQTLNFFPDLNQRGAAGRQGHIFFKSEKTHPIYSCVGRHLERYKQARSIIQHHRQ